MKREIRIEDELFDYTIERDERGQRVAVNGRTCRVRHLSLPDGRSLCLVDGRVIENIKVGNNSHRIVREGGITRLLRVGDPRARRSAHALGGGMEQADIKAPMPGKVVRVLCKSDQVVKAEQGIVVLEAMKMENELRTPMAGRVQFLDAEPGQSVEMGHLVARIVPESDKDE